MGDLGFIISTSQFFGHLKVRDTMKGGAQIWNANSR